MPDTEISNEDDSSDEEAEPLSNIPESDEEQDQVVFDSDAESDELEFESESNDDEDSEDEEDSEEEKEEEEESADESDSENENENEKSSLKPKVPLRIVEIKEKNQPKKSLKTKSNESKKREEKSSKADVENFDKLVSKPVDEYDHDTSDEEDIRNTVGNIPMHWYDEYPHIGYDTEGKPILKPKKGDQLDNFLKRMEDPDFWRTVKDPQTGQNVVLSEEDIDLITRIQKRKIPDSQFDEYAVNFIFFFNFYISNKFYYRF